MSFLRSFGFGLLISIGASLAVAHAQPQPQAQPHSDVAPRASDDANAPYIAVVVTGYGAGIDPADPPMRTPQALVAPFEWFDAGSHLARAHIAQPEGLGYVKLTLGIDAEGAVTRCTALDRSRVPIDEAAVCADVSPQKFVPALDTDGTRTAGQYIVDIAPRGYRVQDTPQPPPLFTKERDPAPAPMMVSRVDSVYRFPPDPFWMKAFYRDPQWRAAPQAGLPKHGTKPNQPLAAIMVFDKGEGLDCRLIERSGIPAQDNAVCGYAKAVLAPSWPDASRQDHRGVPLYIGVQDGDIVAYAPTPDYRTSTTISDEVELRLIAALMKAGVFPEGREASPLRMTLTPNPQGKVTHCRIVTSTGSDAGDVAACRAARRVVVMQPKEDIFGRMYEYAALTWAADPAQP